MDEEASQVGVVVGGGAGTVSVVEPAGIAGLLTLAVERGMDPEGLERLFGLYERDQANKARAAFYQALTDFQNVAPAIVKDSVAAVSSSRGASYSYNYAKLDKVVTSIRPHLMANGLSFRFDSEVSAESVRVKCIVSHVLGHSETTTFACPVGGMAGSNPAQQTASSLSYARRYALIMALGLVTTDEVDDDGLGGSSYLSTKQIGALEALIRKAGVSLEKFLKAYEAPDLEHFPEARFKRAVTLLEGRIADKAKEAA